MRLGLDASSMNAGTLKMMDVQKKAAADYTAFWEAALDKRVAGEVKANEEITASNEAKTAELIKFNDAEMSALAESQAAQKTAAAQYAEWWTAALAEKDAAFFESQKIQNEISAGSIGSGMFWGSAGAAAGGAAVKGAEGAAGHGASGETMVLGREVLRNASMSRIVSSALRLAGMLIDSTLLWVALGLAAITVGTIDELLPDLLGGTSISDWWRARKQAKQSGVDLKQTQGDTRSLYSQHLEEMKKKGLIGQGDYENAKAQLASGDYSQLVAAMSTINKHMPMLNAMDDKTPYQAFSGLPPDATAKEKAAADFNRRDFLRFALADPDTSATDKAKIRVELAKLNLQISKDTIATAKENTEEIKKQNDELAEKAKKQTQYNTDYARLESTLTSEKRKQEIDSMPDMPSIEDLASGGGFITGWKRRIQRDIYNSPFRGLAQDYYGAQQREKEDILMGNAQWTTDPNTGEVNLTGGAAFAEGQLAKQLRGRLSAVGLMTPDERLQEISDRISATNTAIGVLNVAATVNGLVISAGNNPAT